MWAALNAAISAALLAAWHDKWMEPSSRLRPRPRSRPRPRPSEVRSKLAVLDAQDLSGSPVAKAIGSPGVPRHPSHPSGHNTVGGTTAAILKKFFRDPSDHEELDNLADQSGLVRMWACIHDRADETFGIALGTAVVKLVYPDAG